MPGRHPRSRSLILGIALCVVVALGIVVAILTGIPPSHVTGQGHETPGRTSQAVPKTPTPTGQAKAQQSASTRAAASTTLPIGNLPGWKQVFASGFTTPLARGDFPGPYANSWMSYNGIRDTSGRGLYDQSIISVHDGLLDLYLHTQNGEALGAAPIPLVGGKWGGQVYGRFSVRMKADALPNFGISFLLWPDSNDWHQGEIDFPEGELNGPIKGFNHCGGLVPGKNCFGKVSDIGFTHWHTYTIEWTPKRITFLIDGTVFGTTTKDIPDARMHWVGQVGTAGGKKPAPSVAGHLLIDWMTIYTYAP